MELVFYYSGHADEEGLLLNREHYGYRELRERITGIQADMRIVILDSCSSGAITRAKGGVKTSPFLFDTSVSAEGYAFLTSSSADEASQESDSIESSYFTHSLIAGLRGAADSIGDGRVTLNELYRFAYDETLAKTETSRYGAQHPSYDIQISGSGDVVLTDIKETSAGLVIDKELSGQLTIRDSSNFLVAELSKTNRNPLELGLESGSYRITLRQNDSFYRAEVLLTENNRVFLGPNDFVQIAAEDTGRNRGGEPGGDEGSPPVSPENKNSAFYSVFINVVPEGFHFPLIGFVNIAQGDHGSPQIGLVNWNTGRFGTVQLSLLNTAGGDTNGFQMSLVNTTAGALRGVQAGFINTAAGDTNGVQAGLVNTTVGEITGFQMGLINTTTKDTTGFQMGLINTTAGDTKGFQMGLVNISVGKIESFQFGLVNAAQRIAGPQIGLVNGTKRLKGLQFGLFNYVDTIEEGVPIGLLSIVRHGGYLALEASFAEIMPLNLALKIGVEKFYSSISVSYNPRVEDPAVLFGFGIGFGSIIPLSKRFFINPEVNATGTLGFDTSDFFSSLSPLAGFNLGSRFSIIAGPSLTYRLIGEDSNNNTKPLFMVGKEIAQNQYLFLGVKAGMRVRF
jgi:hypothetical protein